MSPLPAKEHGLLNCQAIEGNKNALYVLLCLVSVDVGWPCNGGPVTGQGHVYDKVPHGLVHLDGGCAGDGSLRSQ